MQRTRLIAIAALGAGLAVVVGLYGTPGWQVGRVALVGAGTVAAIAGARRHEGAGWDLALAAIGTVGAAIGLGLMYLRLKHAVTDALSAPGLVVLVAGAVLAATSALRLLRRLRGWRKVPAAIGIALAGVVTVYVVAIPVAATTAPRAAPGTATPAASGVAYRDVGFTTGDGLRLSGWYLPTRSGAGVVMVAGSSSTRLAALDQAVALNREGFGVLLFDARGHGRSEGRAMELGWYGAGDVSAAVGELAGMPGMDPARVGAVGFSKGGEEVLGAMASDPRIRAGVAEGATGRQRDDKAWLASRYGPAGRLQQVLDTAVFGLTDLLNDTGPPTPLRRAVAASAPRPVLLIVAGLIADEQHAAAWMRSGSPDSVTVWVADGAGHVGAFAHDPRRWTDTVTRFLDAALA